MSRPLAELPHFIVLYQKKQTKPVLGSFNVNRLEANHEKHSPAAQVFKPVQNLFSENSSRRDALRFPVLRYWPLALYLNRIVLL